MTSFWRHLKFLQTIVHISYSIEPTNFVLGINTKQHNVHLMIKMKVTLTDDEGHRSPSVIIIALTVKMTPYICHSFQGNRLLES